MSNYTFSTLNDKDLEELVADLLNTEYDLKLQKFKRGKDQGIDLRYSTSKNNNSLVVQVKHYVRSGSKQLIRDLKRDELQKVIKLNPDRYIVATSAELSANEKDSIKEIFYPYIKSSNDIIGGNDLNDLIYKNKEVEKRHFKLWLSSTEIISNILNNAIEGRSRSHLERVKNKLPLYVLTKNFDDANRKLEKERLLLITGLPGVGKTTLADVLLYEKARNGYQVYIVCKIRDAEDVISPDNNVKQVFYFDDFLGEIYYEILTGSQKESEIAAFIDRIKQTPNKFLILSTRTVILQQARNKSNKLKHSQLETGRYEIVLNNYSNLDKAKILYNHLYFQETAPSIFEAITENKFYRRIIEHKNYTPRLIEFITDIQRCGKLTKDQYRQLALRNLSNPEEVWRNSFETQISYFDQCFLYTLFSFQRNISEKNLIKAFDKRMEYERKENNNETPVDVFNRCVKSLMSSFITVSFVDLDKKTKQYNFVNPSLSDFIFAELKNNYHYRKAVIASMCYIEQFQFLFPRLEEFILEEEIQKDISELVRNNKLEGFINFFDTEIVVGRINILFRLCTSLNIDDLLRNEFEKIDLKMVSWCEVELVSVLLDISNCPKTELYIKENFVQMIEAIYSATTNESIAKKLPALCEKYGFNFQTLFDTSNESITLNINELINRILTSKEVEFVESQKNSILNTGDIDSFIYSHIEAVKEELMDEFNLNLSDYQFERRFNEDDFYNIIAENINNEKEAAQREKDRENFFNELIENQTLENNKIDDLFN